MLRASIGNGEAKELICSTHGHDELRRGIAGGKVGTGWRGSKGGKWDNCKSRINKIFFKRTLSGHKDG